MRRQLLFIWKIPNILWYKNFFVAYVIIINPTNPPIIDGNSGPNNIPDNPYSGIVKLNAAKIENLKIDNPCVQDLLLPEKSVIIIIKIRGMKTPQIECVIATSDTIRLK